MNIESEIRELKVHELDHVSGAGKVDIGLNCSKESGGTTYWQVPGYNMYVYWSKTGSGVILPN